MPILLEIKFHIIGAINLVLANPNPLRPFWRGPDVIVKNYRFTIASYRISRLLRGAGFSVLSTFEDDDMLVVNAALGFAGSVSSMTIILPSTLQL